MKSTATAAALVRGVADKLNIRLAANSTINTVRQATDANGWPMLFLSHAGNEAAGQPVIALRIAGIDMVSKDIFGGSTFAYAPHNLEIAYELDSNGKPTPSAQDILAATFEAIKTGVKTQLKEIAHSTAVTEASLNSTASSESLDELNWPTKSI